MNNTTTSFITGCILLFISSSCEKDPLPVNQNPDFTLELLSQSLLPNALKECSGVEITSENKIWIHNDAGNDPILYAVDSDGQLVTSVEITNVSKKDWEDLAQDEAGNLYIGNFGNNDNDRGNLAIYIIPSPDEVVTNTYSPEIISFSFEDQTEFPPHESAFFFDTEGFFVTNGNAYLFTKDRSKPFVGLTNLYEFPAQPGVQIAKKIASFSTSTKKSEGAITGADISPDGKKVALLTHDIIWLFTEFTAPQYLSGTSIQLYITKNHQFEGIVFENDCKVVLANERKDNGEVQMLAFNICR